MSELAHLQLLAEIDALVERLRRWAETAADWPAAKGCQALVRRLAARAAALRLRLEAPLVVATLGGTGTGKTPWSTPWPAPRWSARAPSGPPPRDPRSSAAPD